MQEIITNFHFLRPWWLVLLIVPAVFYWRFFNHSGGLSSWVKVCDKKLLDFLLIKGSSAQRKMAAWVAVLGMSGLIVAIAGPTWKKTEVPSLAPQNPVMIVLEVSSQMQKNDVSPNRLARAKFKINDLLEMLKGQQCGMIVYSKEPFLISPITEDVRLITNLLPEVNLDIMPVNGSRPDRAINLAVEKLKNSGFKQGNIVLFAANGGESAPKLEQAAKKATAEGFDVSSVVISAEDAPELEKAAQLGDGVYAPFTAGNHDLKTVAAKIESNYSAELEKADAKKLIWSDYGYYVVIVPLLCCLYFFRRGMLIWLIIIGCGMAPKAYAGFWLNDNQEGLRAFNNGQYEEAAKKFTREDWKGASFYKNGDYQAAWQEFQKMKGDEALYNQGNALAKSGKIEEAIAKYEEVLKNNPNHEDAKFNLEYLKQQQQQNQQQNNQDQQQQNQQQQNGADDKQQQDQQKQDAASGQEQDQTQEQEQNQASDNDEQKGDNQQSKQPQAEDQPQGNQQDDAPSPQQGQEDERTDQPMSPQGAKPQDTADEPLDEAAIAREQQYRNIPDDPGGLLRAFIYKEYRKNRYGE